MLGRNKAKSGESEPGHERSANVRRALRGAGIVGAIALAGGGGLKIANEKTLEDHAEQETALLDGLRQNTQQCADRVFVLRPGAVYRSTPRVYNDKLPFIIKGNAENELADDRELPVGRPLRYVDDSEDTWLGFSDKKPDQNNPGYVMGSEEAAAKIMWINYTKYEGRVNAQGQEYIGEYPDSSPALAIDCDITVEGQIIADGEPAAYGSPNPAGMFQKIVELPGLNP